MSDSGGERSSRERYAVAAVLVLGLFALYAALGGPIPFVVEGGPSLESVPEKADAVVYTDAWTFSSETSRGVVDGLLAATNRSLPGYTGPASLEAAFRTLQNTSLSPTSLRSVTAFGAYAPGGQPSGYRGMILKTGWNRAPLLDAFGGGREAFEQRTYGGKTVFVADDTDVQFPWIGVLGPDKYVLGNASAVRDTIDTETGSAPGLGTDLTTQFRALARGPVRFSARVPDEIPGDSIAPSSVRDTVAAIETLSGVYYPEDDGAAVDIVVRTADDETAREFEPAVTDAVAFARQQVPERTARLLEDAEIDRRGPELAIGLSGPTEAFVGGYQAILDTGVVGLLLGQPVGEPSLDLVPADAAVVAYGDASVVADPTTIRVANALAAQQNVTAGDGIVETVERLREVSALDLTAFRSVTLFARGGTTNTTDAAAVVEAGWSRAAIAQSLDNANLTTERQRLDGVPVFEFSLGGQRTWLAVLGDGHQALGAPSAVRDVIAVSRGDSPAVGPPLRDAFERLPHGYFSVVSRVPGGLASDLPVGFVSDIEVAGFSYDSAPTNVAVRLDLGLTSPESARNARDTLDGLRAIAGLQVQEPQLRTLLSDLELTRNGSVVSARADTDPEALIALFEWATEQAEGLSVPSMSAEPARAPGIGTHIPTAVAVPR